MTEPELSFMIQDSAKVLDRFSCLTCVPGASLVRRCPPTRARMVELFYCVAWHFSKGSAILNQRLWSALEPRARRPLVRVKEPIVVAHLPGLCHNCGSRTQS